MGQSLCCARDDATADYDSGMQPGSHIRISATTDATTVARSMPLTLSPPLSASTTTATSAASTVTLAAPLPITQPPHLWLTAVSMRHGGAAAAAKQLLTIDLTETRLHGKPLYHSNTLHLSLKDRIEGMQHPLATMHSSDAELQFILDWMREQVATKYLDWQLEVS